MFAAVASKHIDTTASNTAYSCDASATALACCLPVVEVSLGTPRSLSIFGPDIGIDIRPELEGDVNVVLMSNLPTAFHLSKL